MRVGIIGCGNNLRNAKLFKEIEIVACSDILSPASQRLARQYSLREMKVEPLLTADEIEIILNLTLPAGHAEVSRAAIAAGKHVYSEKPLATSLKDAIGARVSSGCTPWRSRWLSSSRPNRANR
jgi:predicted dehydrogenase